jgi:glycine/D-amino acid oxidase-like deaminating enzyme
LYDVVIVGAGLFGAIAAAAFRQQKRSVLVIDDDRPEAGSKPAACLMRPSWYSSLGKEVYTPSLKLLDELYGVQDLKFKVAIGSVAVHWCNPADILKVPDRKTTVGAFHNLGKKGWQVECSDGSVETARSVVVTAGIWTPLLIGVLGGLIGQAGMACLWPKEKIAEPFVRVWAPYRQVTAFNRGDGLWVGDSNSIRMDKWSETNAGATEQRCSQAVKISSKPRRLFGIRPYSKVKPCYLAEAKPGLWLATGGAKNGTLAAGWCASELLRRA